MLPERVQIYHWEKNEIQEPSYFVAIRYSDSGLHFQFSSGEGNEVCNEIKKLNTHKAIHVFNILLKLLKENVGVSVDYIYEFFNESIKNCDIQFLSQ